MTDPMADSDAAIRWIESFATRPPDLFDALPARERQAARFPWMGRLMAALGNPEQGMRVIQVAGTSGKGSTATMIARILGTFDMRVGLYTNPYVARPQERIQINGADIEDDLLLACTRRVRAAVEEIQANDSHFNPHLKMIWVAVMLLAFRTVQVDWAVIEVGMGGRFDETNVVTAEIAVITTIGLDHMEYLGATVTEIAWHKAGIITPHSFVVTGVSQPTVFTIIEQEMARQGLTRWQCAHLGEDFNQTIVSPVDAHPTVFRYQQDDLVLDDLTLHLYGAHQVANAALAIKVLDVLVPIRDTPDVIRSKVNMALGALTIPGRFEVGEQEGRTIILDIAHNPDKMAACVTTLQSVFPDRKVRVLFGTVEGKNGEAMLTTLTALQPVLILTSPRATGRTARPLTQLESHAHQLGLHVMAIADPGQAFSILMATSRTEDILLVTGSLFLVSEIRKLLDR